MKLTRLQVICASLACVAATSAIAQSASRPLEQAVRTPAEKRGPPPVAKPAEAAALPDNLFSMDDRAIIIVGGKEIAVGQIKRQIRADLQRTAGPPHVYNVPARTPGASLPQTMERKPAGERVVSATDVRAIGTETPGSRSRKPKEPSEGDLAIAGELKCLDNLPPRVTRLDAALTPGGTAILQGRCFGDRAGRVEVIGQFPGGKLLPAFKSWTDRRIEMQVPADLRDASDHAVAVTVVTADGGRSTALQGRFVAARSRVQVPERNWTPSALLNPIAIDRAGGNIFTGSKVWGANAANYESEYRVAVNPDCALEDMATTARRGRVHKVLGWEDGPPHESSVRLVWSPACTTHTISYGIGSSSQRICSADIELTAWAVCPVGRSP